MLTRTMFALLCAGLMGCPPGTLPGASGTSAGGQSGGVSPSCQGDFGASAAAERLEVFLSATSEFTASAAKLSASLDRACGDMARELDIAPDRLEPKQGEPALRAKCGAVASELDAQLSGLRAEANVRVDVVAVPPRCEVSMDAYAECAAQCDAQIEPGQVDLRCEGGEIVGRCTGECTGTCAVEAQGKCEGSCHGVCEGGCRGRCQGACEGQCAQKGADGQCNGRCDGACRGECSAGCQGECQGECWVEGRADCSGECRGGCSVEYEQPRCTGEVVPPRVDADCQASCDARVNAQASCSPGRMEVQVAGDASGNVRERLAMVRAALEAGYPAVLQARAHLKRLEGSAKAMGKASKHVPEALGDLGLSAKACATQAASAIVGASAQISLSVEVSASVSGSVSGGAG